MANPDGSFTRTDSAAPVRVKQGDKWFGIDLSLEKKADGSWAPRASTADISIDGGAPNEAARVTFEDGTSLAVTWPGTLPEPIIDGGTATYKLSSATDLLIIATADGLNAHIRLNKAPATEDPVFKLGLRGDGVQVSESNGGLALKDEQGRVLGKTSELTAWDARVDDAGDPARTVDLDADLSYKSVSGDITTQTLELTAPEGYLDDPNTRYPVIIDPNVTGLNIARDTWIRSGTSAQGSDAKLVVGKINGDSNTNPARAYIQFYNNWLADEGLTVTQATLTLWQYYAYTCSDRPMAIHAVESDWNADLTWPNKPNADNGLAGVYVSRNNLGGPGCTNGPLQADLTGMMQAWVAGRPSHGIRLMASNETQSSYERRFCSGNPSSGHAICNNAGGVPQMQITYTIDDEEVADSVDDAAGELVTPDLVEQADPALGQWTQGDSEASDGGVSAAANDPYASWGLTNPFKTYNAPAWGACGNFDSKDKLVRSFYRTPFAGGAATVGMRLALRCGPIDKHNYGYWHLVIPRSGEQSKADAFQSFNPTRNWRDFADWAISWVARQPSSVYYSVSKQTWCYERPFHFYQGRNYVKTRYVTVAMGKTARRLISAYPNEFSRCANKGTRVY